MPKVLLLIYSLKIINLVFETRQFRYVVLILYFKMLPIKLCLQIFCQKSISNNFKQTYVKKLSLSGDTISNFKMNLTLIAQKFGCEKFINFSTKALQILSLG